jgi:TRAP-type uncharacterized transport system substrate-binding protein
VEAESDRRSFSRYRLGDRIARVVGQACARRPPWWSLDFWVDPDPHNLVSIANVPTAGTEDALRRLLVPKRSPGHVDLAIVQDGLVDEGPSSPAGEPASTRLRSLVPLYWSVLCAFVPKEGKYHSLDDLRASKARIYVGQEGSGARILSRRLLDLAGIRYVDCEPAWTADSVVRTMTENDGSRQFDAAFVLAKPGSDVLRRFAESGRFELIPLDDADDLIRGDESLQGLTTLRPVLVSASSLSPIHHFPARDVVTLETQTILACTSELPDRDAFQVTRVLCEHFKELGIGSEPGDIVFQPDPSEAFDFPLHDGAARYYRRESKAEAFPYPVLVVAIGASVALFAFWHSHVQKWRADRLARAVDESLVRNQDRPDELSHQLAAARFQAVILFKDGLINKEGFERISEHLKVLQSLCEASHG